MRTILVAILGLTACEGQISERVLDAPLPTSTYPDSSPASYKPFECVSSAQPTSVAMRRLSRVQYVNTVADLVRRALPSDAAGILSSLSRSLATIPSDSRVGAPGERRGGFSVVDQSLQQAHTDAAYDLAVTVGREFTSSSARLGRLLGPCATDASRTNDAACLEAFVRAFGARVYRRPLDDQEVSFLLEGSAGNSVAAPFVSDVVALLFASPPMTFMVEHGTEATAEVSPLSAYELATRLSYHFWRTTPDDALWQAAASGELLTEVGLRTQVERLASDSRAQATWREFFSEWFSLHELAELNGLAQQPAFISFAGADMPNDNTREAAIDDVLDMAQWTVTHQGSLSTLLNESRSFSKDPLLARFYGAAPWDGASEPPAPGSPRAGLLTRVAFLASGTADTRPILKGARIRNSLMCQVIQLPDGDVAAVAPKPSPTATTREVVEALTEVNPACGGCHQKLINPLGFATENYDGLGRLRSAQVLFDEAGQRTGEKKVNTTTQPFLRGPGDDAVVQGAADLTPLLDESKQVHGCFARQYFRFAHSRIEDIVNDGCSLAETEKVLLSGASLTDVFKHITLESEFRQRSFK
jgi:hypothetical protein